MEDSGVISCYFGYHAWIGHNPGFDCQADEKRDLGVQVERHAAVQQSLGRVTFKGLLDVDRRFELERMMDVNGDKQQPVTMSLHDILMGWKGERGVCLFQTIATKEDGN